MVWASNNYLKQIIVFLTIKVSAFSPNYFIRQQFVGELDPVYDYGDIVQVLEYLGYFFSKQAYRYVFL